VIATQLVTEGSELLISPTVSAGNPIPVYQWYHNGASIPGANSATYSTNPVPVDAGGLYSLVTSNCIGMSSNVVANVTIQIPLLLSFLTATNGDKPQFALTGVASHAFTIQTSSNFLNWIPLYTNKTPHLPVIVPDPASFDPSPRFYRAIPFP